MTACKSNGILLVLVLTSTLVSGELDREEMITRLMEELNGKEPQEILSSLQDMNDWFHPLKKAIRHTTPEETLKQSIIEEWLGMCRDSVSECSPFKIQSIKSLGENLRELEPYSKFCHQRLIKFCSDHIHDLGKKIVNDLGRRPANKVLELLDSYNQARNSGKPKFDETDSAVVIVHIGLAFARTIKVPIFTWEMSVKKIKSDYTKGIRKIMRKVISVYSILEELPKEAKEKLKQEGNKLLSQYDRVYNIAIHFNAATKGFICHSHWVGC